VSHIVVKLTELLVLRAHIGIKGWTNGSRLQIVPVGVAVRAASVVAPNNVVGVGDPDRCRGLISVEKRPGATHIEDQIVFDQVLAFDSIFNEDGVTHGVVGNVVLDTKVVNTVNCHSTVEGVMDGVVTNI